MIRYYLESGLPLAPSHPKITSPEHTVACVYVRMQQDEIRRAQPYVPQAQVTMIPENLWY